MHNTNHKKTARLLFCGGFSLIELLVTMSIVVIVTSVSLANYPSFSEKLSLKRTVQEVALSIRQAQIYGGSVKKFEGATIEDFPGYGVYFSEDSSFFSLFADEDNDHDYAPAEQIRLFEIKTGDKISTLKCDGLSCPGRELQVVFVRPGPTVHLVDGSGGSHSVVEITVQSRKEGTKVIKVYVTGQISVGQ